MHLIFCDAVQSEDPPGSQLLHPLQDPAQQSQHFLQLPLLHLCQQLEFTESQQRVPGWSLFMSARLKTPLFAVLHSPMSLH